MAIVANPEQVAATLREYMDLGATTFCLSSYPHHLEATRLKELVMPCFSRRRLAAGG